jgi:hypothetical protein
MTACEARLRQNMMDGSSHLRHAMAHTRVERLKWSFMFWIGQVVAIGGLVSIMLVMVRP